MSAAELAGGFRLADHGDVAKSDRGPLPPPDPALPEDTQRLTLLAAADPVGDAASGVARVALARHRDGTPQNRRRESTFSRSVPTCTSVTRWCGRWSTATPLPKTAVPHTTLSRPPPTPRPTRIATRGIGPRQRPARTRTSPPSSSARQAAPRPAAAWLLRRHSWNVLRRSPRTRHAAASGRWPPRRSASKPVSSMRRSACWPRRCPNAGRARRRASGPAPRTSRLRRQCRQRGHAPAAKGGEAARAPGPALAARPTSTRGAPRCSPATSPRPAAVCSTCPGRQGQHRHPTGPPPHPTCSSTAWRPW